MGGGVYVQRFSLAKKRLTYFAHIWGSEGEWRYDPCEHVQMFFACQKGVDIFTCLAQILGIMIIWPWWKVQILMSRTMCNAHISGILTKMTLVEMGKSFHSQRALEMSRLAERWASQVLATSVNFCSSKYSLLKDQGALLYLLDGLTTQLIQFLTSNCVPFTLFNTYKGAGDYTLGAQRYRNKVHTKIRERWAALPFIICKKM